ncbi:MAG: Asp/Glu racemase, partial [Reyranella sp.]|nr:Asp/Glu racemase [Reyranella sp.]
MFEPMPDTSSDRILVINPNSTEAVTRGIDAAMEPLRITGGPAIECVTLKDGPPGIESQAHAEQVVPLVGAMVKKRDNDCSAFVIACYSDPGLHAARELTAKPVLGIAECGILTALTLGQRFGVISILRKSIPRHLRYVGQMGLTDRMAGDRAIGLGVVELSDETRTFSRMAEVAAELRDEDGADVLVMG